MEKQFRFNGRPRRRHEAAYTAELIDAMARAFGHYALTDAVNVHIAENTDIERERFADELATLRLDMAVAALQQVGKLRDSRTTLTGDLSMQYAAYEHSFKAVGMPEHLAGAQADADIAAIDQAIALLDNHVGMVMMRDSGPGDTINRR